MNSYLWVPGPVSGDDYLYESGEDSLAEPVREEDLEGDGEYTAW